MGIGMAPAPTVPLAFAFPGLIPMPPTAPAAVPALAPALALAPCTLRVYLSR